MATDNTQLSAAVGDGDLIRDLADTDAVKWPVGVASFVSGGSADAWTLQTVDATHGLPVAQQGTWTIGLPTGAATAANQATEIASLASIDGKTPTLGQALAAASIPVVLTASQLTTLTPPAAITGFATSAKQDTGNTSLASIDGKITAINTGACVISAAIPAGTNVIGHVIVDSGTLTAVTAITNALPAGSNAIGGVTQSGTWNVTNISGTVSLPTGAATAAKQDTGNTSVASIDTKTPALGQALAAASVPIVLTASQLTTLTPPAAITGFATSAKQDTGNTSLASIDGKITAVNTGAVVISSALPAGTNVIGHVLVDSGTITTVSAVTAISNALPAGTNLLGKVGIDQTTPGTTNAVQEVAGTGGGLTPYTLTSANSTNATSVKGSAGNVYKINAFNTNAAARWLKFYNKASAPTVGTDTVVWKVMIPGNTAGAGVVDAILTGLTFSTGIAIALTTGVADSDTGAVAASEIVVNLGYK